MLVYQRVFCRWGGEKNTNQKNLAVERVPSGDVHLFLSSKSETCGSILSRIQQKPMAWELTT